MYEPIQHYGFVASDSMMQKFMAAYNRHSKNDFEYEDVFEFANDMGFEEFDADCIDGFNITPVITGDEAKRDIGEEVKNDFNFFVYWLNNEPTLFTPAYNSIDDVVSEIQNLYPKMEITTDEIIACIANVKISVEYEDDD